MRTLKHRHRAMLRLRDGHVGTGFLQGLGFYVDHGEATRGGATLNDSERGFISPYTLTAQEKDARITRLIREEAARVVPMVLAKG